MIHRAQVGVSLEAQVRAAQGLGIGLLIHNEYEFVARDRYGKLKWREVVPNLTTTQGLNDLLTKYFKGSAYTAAWFMGLIDNAGFSTLAAGDTAAQIGGSNAWSESSAYSESVRQTLTLGSASAGSINNTASKAVFTCNTNSTVIKGGFIVSNSTKAGTTGILYGEAAFASNKSLDSGDVLTVGATLTAATA